MAKAPKKTPAKKPPVRKPPAKQACAKNTVEPEICESLQTAKPGFAFTRYWRDGDGPREGIFPCVGRTADHRRGAASSHRLCSDRGYADALSAWRAYLADGIPE